MAARNLCNRMWLRRKIIPPQRGMNLDDKDQLPQQQRNEALHPERLGVHSSVTSHPFSRPQGLSSARGARPTLLATCVTWQLHDGDTHDSHTSLIVHTLQHYDLSPPPFFRYTLFHPSTPYFIYEDIHARRTGTHRGHYSIAHCVPEGRHHRTPSERVPAAVLVALSDYRIVDA